MHKAQWIIGSCLVVAAGSALPTVLCVYWLSRLPPSDGMEAILCIFAGTVGTLIGFVVSLSAVLAIAKRSESRTGRSSVGSALVGGFLPIGLFIAGFFGYSLIEDFQDKTERAEAELAALLAHTAPALPAGTPMRVTPRDLSEAAGDCEVGTRWWDAQSIALGDDAPESISYLHRQLTDDGWFVEFTRVVDPLETYEIWVVAGVRGDVYVDARSVLSHGGTDMTVMVMVGPCVAEQGRSIVQAISVPGAVVEQSFVEPELRGLARTDLDPALWAPRLLDSHSRAPKCEHDDGLARSDAQRLWSGNAADTHLDYVEDPHGEAVRWLAEMQTGLEADGWQTVYTVKRERDPLADSEQRTLSALRGEQLVRLSVDFQLALAGGTADPFVRVETDTFSGPCVADVGFELSVPHGQGFLPVNDADAFEPIIRKDQ